MSFQAAEIGNELFAIYEKTGIQPFERVENQRDLTPIQKWIVAITIGHNNKKKEEKIEEAKGGGGSASSSPPSGSGSPRLNSAYDKREELMKSNVGGGEVVENTYINQDFDEGAAEADPESALFMSDDEVMTDPESATGSKPIN